MLPTGNFRVTAKTFFGLENLLAKEIEDLGGKNVDIIKRAVQFNADYETLYKVNLWSRIAIKVLVPIKSFSAKNENQLYNEVKKLPWEELFGIDDTFAIDPTIFSEYFKHSQYPALKTKDAIVDRFREKQGKRPSIDKDEPDFGINLHISDDRCTISLDSSGAPLFKRGYRKNAGEAPLNECLAAGLILLSDWDQQKDFVDPFCGSGTIPIEAGLIATNTPPQFRRKDFGFMNWPNFDEDLWFKIKTQGIAGKRDYKGKIIGTDKDRNVIRIAQENVVRAELRASIKLDTCDFTEHDFNDKSAHILSNPPYGVRLQQENMIDFYKEIGNWFKQKCQGNRTYLFSSNLPALKFVGLKPSKKTVLFNGSLECKLQAYDIYSGSKKASKQ